MHPTIAVLLGGDTDEYAQDAAFVDALIAQVLAACEAADGQCLVTTSRRTAPDAERVLEERLAQQPRCRLLLLASRDPLDGTMDGLLGSATVAVVTGESISMVSEACASGRPVIVVEPPLRRPNQQALTKHQRFLQDLAGLGHVRLSPLPELGAAIQDTLASPRPIRPLQTAQRVIDAVERLL
jgi:mitochondrial fission protein ELM1